MLTPTDQLFAAMVEAAAAEAERRVMERLQASATPDKDLFMEEAAQYLSISISVLRRLCKEKRIPHRTHGAIGSKNPRYIFSSRSLDQWKRKQEEKNYIKEN